MADIFLDKEHNSETTLGLTKDEILDSIEVGQKNSQEKLAKEWIHTKFTDVGVERRNRFREIHERISKDKIGFINTIHNIEDELNKHSVTIEEYKRIKKDTEETITELLKDFEAVTGVGIKHLDLIKFDKEIITTLETDLWV